MQAGVAHAQSQRSLRICKDNRTCIQNPRSYTGTITHGGICYKLFLIVLTIHRLPLEIPSLLQIVPSKGLTHQIVPHYDVIADVGQCLREIRTLQTNKQTLESVVDQYTLECVLKRQTCGMRQDTWKKGQSYLVMLQVNSTSTPHCFCGAQAGAKAYTRMCTTAFGYHAHVVCNNWGCRKGLTSACGFPLKFTQH